MFDTPKDIWDICPKDMKQLHFFSEKLLFFLIVCALFIYFRNFDVFLHMPIFIIRVFQLILDVLTFAQCVEFLKRSTVSGGRYFVIFQPKDMLKACVYFLSNFYFFHKLIAF